MLLTAFSLHLPRSCERWTGLRRSCNLCWSNRVQVMAAESSMHASHLDCIRDVLQILSTAILQHVSQQPGADSLIMKPVKPVCSCTPLHVLHSK